MNMQMLQPQTAHIKIKEITITVTMKEETVRIETTVDMLRKQ